jgi:hypothetical protein
MLAALFEHILQPTDACTEDGLQTILWVQTIYPGEPMCNRVLNIGVAILTLFSLPSCTTDQADEANGTSEGGPAENLESPREQADEPGLGVRAPDVESTEGSSSDEDGRNGLIEDTTTTSLLGCGLNPYNDRTCYTLYNCWNHPVRWIIVKYNGGTTGCFYLPPGGTLSGCLASGRASHIETCPW